VTPGENEDITAEHAETTEIREIREIREKAFTR
jgi:hypothetical protein